MIIEMKPIGIIRTPFTELAGMPNQPSAAAGIEGTIEVYDEFREGLAGLDGYSHISILFYFHRSSGYSLRVIPFMDTKPRGLFATRAPRRPNQIGLSVVRLKSVRGAVLEVCDVDMLDGTPLLDIKPWFPE